MHRLFALLVTSVVAGDAIAGKMQSEESQVFKVAKNYATSIACVTTFENDGSEEEMTTLSDIIPWSSEMNDLSMGGSTYLVYWGGDWGCAGGSGTYSSFLTEIGRRSDYRNFIVQQHDILSDIEGLNPRFIESVSSDEGLLKIISSDYADEKFGGTDGGNNFPANKFEYTIDSSTSQIINKKLLEQNQ